MEFSNDVQPINVDEMKNAEKEILRLVQRESFLSEINALQNAKRPKTDDDVKGQRFKNVAGRNSPLRWLHMVIRCSFCARWYPPSSGICPLLLSLIHI